MACCGCSSPLRAAMRKNDLEEIKFILQTAGEGVRDIINDDTSADCLLDWIDCMRTPRAPIFTAVAKGHVDMLRLFIDYGADLTMTGAKGETVMHMACGYNNLQIARILHETNADLIHSEDNDGRLPIHWACASLSSTTSGDIEVLKWLLGESKSLMGKADVKGDLPVEYAKSMKNIVAVQFLNDMEKQ